MDTLTSAEAADLLGVNPQKLHRLVTRHDVRPVLEAPGKRGAKFWLRRDIERLAAAVADEAVA